MTAPTHQMFGASFGLGVITVTQSLNMVDVTFFESIVYMCLVVFGSLLPDLDTTNSKLGSRFPFLLLSVPMFILFGHRTITHSLFFVLLTAGVSTFICYGMEWNLLFALGLSLGVLSHIIGDFFFEGGIPVFYPIKKRYRPIFTFKTKGIGEFAIRFFLISLNVYLFFMF